MTRAGGPADLRLVQRALARDAQAVRELVDLVAPVVAARVGRALGRRGAKTGRDARQEIEDTAQEVFAALFADDGKVLRAWDPARGLSLVNFVGLVAEREVASILRSGKRSPWTESPAELEDLEALDPDLPTPGAPLAADRELASRETLALIVERVRAELTPRGLELFFRLVVEEESVESVCATTGMSPDAVYAWRSRLAKLVRRVGTDLVSDPGLLARKPSVEEAS